MSNPLLVYKVTVMSGRMGGHERLVVARNLAEAASLATLLPNAVEISAITAVTLLGHLHATCAPETK